MGKELNKFILKCVNRSLKKLSLKVDFADIGHNSLPLQHIEAWNRANTPGEETAAVTVVTQRC